MDEIQQLIYYRKYGVFVKISEKCLKFEKDSNFGEGYKRGGHC